MQKLGKYLTRGSSISVAIECVRDKGKQKHVAAVAKSSDKTLKHYAPTVSSPSRASCKMSATSSQMLAKFFA